MRKILLLSFSLAAIMSLASAEEDINQTVVKISDSLHEELNVSKSNIEKNITVEKTIAKIGDIGTLGQETNQTISEEKNEAVEAAEARIEQLSKNSCDIGKLKLAVVKLIHKVEDLENINNKLKKENINLSNELTKTLEKTKDLNQILEPKKEELICTTKKVLVKKSVNEKVIEGSYKKFKRNQTFTARNDLSIYILPILGSEKTEYSLKKGESFVADKWTYAGWVHVKDKGWVKGYKLNPIFSQKKVKGKKTKFKFKPIYKEVQDCRKVIKD